VALAGTALAGWFPAPGAGRPAAGADARLNVVLLTVDTLRPDALGWVAGRNPTPHLDELAAGGFRFAGAVSPAPLTLPSHASLLTGLLPRRHGLRDNGQVLPAGGAAGGPPTLAEALAGHGWSTAAFVSGFPLAAGFGLDRGFDRYDDEFTAGRGDRLERPAGATAKAALAWARTAPEPWLLWVHFYDPHDPYEPPPGLARPGPRSAYDGEVIAVDRAVGTLREGLAAAAAAPVLTVFAADHGESLGEHGEATHGFFVYQSTVAVPLVFHQPGRVAPGESAAAARLIDVAPTVLDLLGLPAWDGIDGISLTPLLAGRQQEVPPAYAESRRPWISYRWAPLAAVIDGGWKLIAAPRPELYDLTADSGETENLIDRERRRARALQAALREVEARPAATAATSDDPETVARLRALGYAAGTRAPAGEPPPGLPDPKDRIALWNLLGEAESLVERGRAREAVAKLDAVLEAEPDNPFALSRSGAALAEAGDFAAALPRLRRATEVDPDQPETRRAFAFALNRLGRHEEAAGEWMEAVRLQPRRPELWVNLGGSLGLAGAPRRAVEAFRRAVEIEPEDPALLIRLAFAEHAAGDRAGAAGDLARAAELTGPDSFPHAGALGLLLADLDRPAEARPWLARSRPAEPEYAPARYRLAELLAAAGEREAARRALAEALAADAALRERAAADPNLRALLAD
jgi:arylsulfatase A-like enzyme/Flp pilus assembly protein TadD